MVTTGGRGEQRRLLFFDLMFDFQRAVDVEGDVFHLMIEFGSDQSRRVGIEHLVDGRHHAHGHQLLDYFAGFDAHLTRQIGRQ